MIKNKLIIFDLDGTLYKFKNGSFINSGLQKKVLKNALSYIQKKLKQSKSQAKNTLKIIQEEYGEDISIALEEKYGCSRQDYFNEVWNISAKGIIIGDKNIKNILLELAKENTLLHLLSAVSLFHFGSMICLKLTTTTFFYQDILLLREM